MATATFARASRNIRRLQDLLGDAVNAVLVGKADPKKALDGAQAEAREAVLKRR